MYKVKNKKTYWLFRSMIISGIIVFCIMFLGLGILECYARIKSTVTGEKVTVLERVDDKIYFLGNAVGSLGVLMGD